MTSQRRNRSGGRSGLALIGLLLATSAAAHVPVPIQQHPNRGRGFDPEGSYQMGEIDHVNLFNGSPVLTIPISQAYPLGGGLSYALTLTYSGNVWDYEERQEGQTIYKQALPNRRSNAGLGWLLSLGRMILPTDPTNNTGGLWVYEGSDGADHILYPTLHNGETSTSGVFYSRDGTYFRFKSGPMTLEYPSGRIDVFNAQGQLTQITDRSGNYLNVTYPNSVTWQLTDQHGRSHFV